MGLDIEVGGGKGDMLGLRSVEKGNRISLTLVDGVQSGSHSCSLRS